MLKPIAPTQNLNPFIAADRFERALVLHIVKNVAADRTFNPPLILGVHGRPGEGKTFQCDLILRRMGIQVFMISGGELEDEYAGAPAKLIRHTYQAASKAMIDDDNRVSVLMFNDIDTGIGNWGPLVQRTVNTQIVYNTLMNIVDYPRCVGQVDTLRVPIIMTGNDFTKLYEPLVRAGRMWKFRWEPTLDEKANIIATIFPQLELSACQQLIRQLSTDTLLPISFFSSLKTSLVDDQLWEQIQDYDLRQLMRLMRHNARPRFEYDFSYDVLLAAGQKLLAASQIESHLGS